MNPLKDSAEAEVFNRWCRKRFLSPFCNFQIIFFEPFFFIFSLGFLRVGKEGGVGLMKIKITQILAKMDEEGGNL